MSDVPHPDCPESCRITDCVAMAHVADVDRSAKFYALLGFDCISRFSGPDGRTNWCRMKSAQAQLMLSRASGPVDAADQAVLFYMYSNNVSELRQHLLTHGIPDRGRPVFGDGATPASPVGAPAVFEIARPFYMPEGELRVHDPDGYCILVGQLD